MEILQMGLKNLSKMIVLYILRILKKTLQEVKS